MVRSVLGRKLLVVEDNGTLRREIATHFTRHNNDVTAVSTLSDARRALAEEKFDAIILDLILPDGEGLELFELGELPPVVIMTSLSDEYDMLEGLSSGAADYVVKPCSLEVLEARLSLRLLPAAESELAISGLVLNATTRKVFYGAKEIVLTGTEFNILRFLMENAGKFFPADRIYECIWKEPSVKSNTIRYHVSNLRQKLLAATGRNLIVAEYGKGYSFIKGGTQ